MSVEFKDYYSTLGVSKTASADEIKVAFRKLARRYHPDVTKEDKVTAEAKFKEINEAYEVLSDSEKRKRYDELGANWQQNDAHSTEARGTEGFRGDTYKAGGADGNRAYHFNGTGFSDFFEQFFGGGGQYGFARGSGYESGRAHDGQYQTDFKIPGQDIEADILVTLEEVLQGATRKITLRRPDASAPNGEMLNTYQVRIPTGIHDGQRIRLAGQGYAGSGGAPAGDLYLRARLARHPDFQVQDTNLLYDLELAPWEAVLGAKIKIPVLGTMVMLTIPPGTISGRQIRLRNQGLPIGEGKRGDFYVIISIQVPADITPEQRELWEKLASTSSDFHPRD